MKNYFKEVINTFFPSEWESISKKKIGKAVGFFSKTLLLVFILLLVFNAVKLFHMPSVISDQLSKFDSLKCRESDVNMSVPIRLPRFEPVLVVDTTGQYDEITAERMLVTREKIFYRPLLKVHEVDTSELKDLAVNRQSVSFFLSALVFFVLPSIIFYAYITVWLKLFLITLLLSVILFILFDLTHWKRKWRDMFVVCCYVSPLPLLLEVVISFWNADLLIPVFNILDLIQVYLVPIAAMGVLAGIAVLLAYYAKKKGQNDF